MAVLPWRVQFQDPGFRRQVFTLVVVVTLLAGAFSQGLSVNLTIGRSDGARDLVGATGAAGGGGSTAADGGAGIDGSALVTGDGSSTVASADGGSTGSAASEAGGSAVAGRGGVTSAGRRGVAGVAAAGAPIGERCAGAQLRDNDKGVSKDTLKVGILAADLGPLAAAGFNVGVAGNYDKMMKAWAQEFNATGGVACRKVAFVKENFDVLSVDDMVAKCKRMTQDHKVFTVLTPGGYDSVAQLCIARDNKTPFITAEAEPEDWYRESAPYLWNILMSKDRMHRNHVRYLLDSKTLTPAKKVGVIYHAIPNVGPSVEKALLPELTRGGIKPVRVTKLSSDNEQALAQINQAVVEYQAAGIDFVFMPMNLIFKSQFMQQAEKQNYYPQYTDSDHYYGCFDFVTAAYPSRSWDRTKCVTATTIYGRPDLEAFTNAHPFAKYGDAVYKRANPEGYDERGEKTKDQADAQRALHLTVGTLLALWKQAADRAGPDLTRASWGASMGQTGVFDKIVSPVPLTFGPNKWDGPDHIAVVQWHAEAGGGFPARRYRQIQGATKAYV